MCTELRTSAVYLMLEPMLTTVLESLFELLPTAMSQSRLLSFQPISCIVAFSMIDEDMLLSFLSQKELSNSLLISQRTQKHYFKNFLSGSSIQIEQEKEGEVKDNDKSENLETTKLFIEFGNILKMQDD